jgi:hypothetical protein
VGSVKAAAKQRITAPPRSTIELGDVARRDEAGPDPRGSPPRLRRDLVAGSLALLCLLGLTASTRVRPGLTEPLWTTTVDPPSFGIGSESLYLTELGGKVVTGRRLETGELRWWLETDDPSVSIMDVGRGMVAVTTLNPESPRESQPDTAIVLLAEETGAVLARRPGSVLTPLSAGQLLLVEEGQGEITRDCDGAPGFCTHLAAVAIGSGAEAWRISYPVDGEILRDWSPTSPINRFAYRGPGGTVVVRDAATGTVIDTIALAQPAFGPPDVTAALYGDILVTAARYRGRAEITGYRLGPLARAWSLAVPVEPVNESNSRFALSGCDGLVCLRVNAGTTIIDPGSGELRLQLAPDVIKRLGGGGLLAVPSAEQNRQTGARRVVTLLDPTSGRTVAAFPESGIVDWPDGGGKALLMHLGPERTGFTILDEQGRPRPLGSLPGTGLNCSARRTILVCSVPSGLVRVWRLPV